MVEWNSAELKTTRPLPVRDSGPFPAVKFTERKKPMARYFMGGTPLEGLERMMMDPSRQVRDDDQMDGQETEKAPLSEQRGGKEQK